MCYLFVLLALNTSKIIILASHTRNGLTVVLILNTSQLHCNIVKVKPLFLAFNTSLFSKINSKPIVPLKE